MQHLLAVDVTDAIDMGIGQGVAEPCLIGKKPNQPTEADSIMPTIPQLEDQHAKRKERPTECVKRDVQCI